LVAKKEGNIGLRMIGKVISGSIWGELSPVRATVSDLSSLLIIFGSPRLISSIIFKAILMIPPS
jgi:hypothetical protein